MIEKLKLVRDPNDEEGFPYEDEEGIAHRSPADYLAGILGFCGCGDPIQIMMEYVRPLLEKLDSHQWGAYEDFPYMFFVYWANDKGFAEHGTTARCSWLTDQGKELLEDIRKCSA